MIKQSPLKKEAKLISNEKGQSLIELVVVMAVGAIVIASLAFATIASLRSSQLAKNQAQATKLAQEGIEKVRAIRDRDDNITASALFGSPTPDKFSRLYTINMSSLCTNINPLDNDPCYFIFVSGVPNQASDVSFETLQSGLFERQIRIADQSSTYGTEKHITLVVKWKDFSGDHQSQLTTVLRKVY